MKKRKLLLAALVLGLILVMSIAPAMAYFTDHTEADGTLTVELGSTTTMEESISGNVKSITITNAEDSNEACWVRAQAYAGSNVELAYEGSGWSKDGDWYVYETPLDPGDKTAELKITITPPEGAADGDEINVAVVYESTKVLYREDGTPKAADWALKGKEGGGE